MKSCSFCPKINISSNYIKINNLQAQDFYKKNIEWKEKIKRDSCPYHPVFFTQINFSKRRRNGSIKTNNNERISKNNYLIKMQKIEKYVELQ